MKSYFQIALLILYLPALGAYGAAFQNLNFESATLIPIPGDSFNRVYFDQAFPGWRGYVGGIQETAAFHNGNFLCCSEVSLWTSGRIIEGNFSVGLHGARDPYQLPSVAADAAIAQTGLVPGGAQSLLFRAQGGLFEVELGGEPLSLVPLLMGSDYTMFGADIRPWAGQETELRFTASGSVDPLRDSFLLLDSIQFSTTSIPEPSTFALFAVTGIVGWFYWRRKRR